jgi:hypothetical protein
MSVSLSDHINPPLSADIAALERLASSVLV